MLSDNQSLKGKKDIFKSNKYQCLNNVIVGTITLLLIALYLINVPNVVKYLFAGIFLVVLFFSKEEASFYSLMFIICGNELLNLGTTSLTMIFVAIFTAKYFIMGKGFTREISEFGVVTIGLLGLFCLFTLVNGSSEQLVATIKQIFFLVYIWAVLDEVKDDYKNFYGNTFRFIALGINYFGVISIIVNGFPSLAERYSFSEEITINFLAIICSLTIINLLYDWLVLKCKYKWLNIILIMGCCIWGILTQSRSFILAVGIGVILLFLFTSSWKLKFQIFLTILLAGGALFLLCYFNLTIRERIEAVLMRIINPTEGDISNGRYTLWETTINEMYNNPYYTLFGVGDYNRIGAVVYDKIQVAHNLFLETWVIYGYIGCILIVILFYYFIKNVIFNKGICNFSLVSLIPLIVMVCVLFYSHHFIGRSMSLVFIISWIPIALTKKEKIKGQI